MANYTGADKRLAYLFQHGGGGGGSDTLAGLTDVDLDNLTNGQVIKWDDTAQKWVNADESGGGSGGGGIGYFDGAHLIEEHINVTSLNYEAPKDCWAQCIAKAYNAGTGAQILFDGSIVFANANTYDVVTLIPCKKGTIITSRSGGNYGLYSLRLYEMLPAGGSGGNANVWTGTAAEYEQQAAQIPDDTVVLITDDEENTEAFEIYSTAERIIGEWDGKPLYRRILPQVQITSGAVTYTHNIGIKYYINIGGTCTVNGQTSNTMPFPFYQSRWNGYCGIQATDANTITFDSNWNNDTIDCFIEYTKEADYT